ncbi:hypothetical protein [Curtobacterium sp. C2H10]|uniref:hypothetical protein n=1 Tax=Curtobacterium sp. C2H10 TaxID=2736664 RepID=UPI0021BF50E9|nr:hypothetical protein [Curtobacterium sp. C2H10]MCT9620742.1 hypothetical protein [Curtobacterium sp. C2H10]
MARTSASSKWQARALAAEAERDEIKDKYDVLLDRLMTGLADALIDGGYVPQKESTNDAS